MREGQPPKKGLGDKIRAIAAGAAIAFGGAEAAHAAQPGAEIESTQADKAEMSVVEQISRLKQLVNENGSSMGEGTKILRIEGGVLVLAGTALKFQPEAGGRIFVVSANELAQIPNLAGLLEGTRGKSIERGTTSPKVDRLKQFVKINGTAMGGMHILNIDGGKLVLVDGTSLKFQPDAGGRISIASEKDLEKIPGFEALLEAAR